MRLRSVTLLCCTIASAASAQSETVDFEGHQWRIAAQDAHIEEHLGRTALSLSRGTVWDDAANFSDGVIEFDAAYAEEQVFVGAGWRAEETSHFEQMYFRGHLNNKPDALQYTPVVNALSAWQIFSDKNAIAPVSQKYGDWNKVKIVVEGDKADIYFNSDTPVLHIPDLKTDIKSGAINLRHSGRQAGPAYFSNIAIRPLAAGERVVGTPKETPPLPDGLINHWSVSSVFHEDDVAETLTLKKNAAKDLEWTRVDVETNGIANLSKANPRLPDGGSTVWVRQNINADKAQMKELTFGYSDRVRIYLNGKRVYYGDAGWRVRDYRFLGTVGFFDSVGLDLKKGENELLVAVSETFGGWAWAGAIEDREGLSLK